MTPSGLKAPPPSSAHLRSPLPLPRFLTLPKPRAVGASRACGSLINAASAYRSHSLLAQISSLTLVRTHSLPSLSHDTLALSPRAMILPHHALRRETLGSEFGTTPNTKPQPRLDGVGVWWLTFAGVWTAFLFAGMAYLHRKRDSPTLRIRGLPLTFAGIILLHLYWISVQIGYSFGPLAPEVAEFWIMSIWYPFGIALFQAGNSRFLHVAKAQSRFARPPSQMGTRFDEKRRPQEGGMFHRLRRMDYSRRMFLFVSLGMACQVSTWITARPCV